MRYKNRTLFNLPQHNEVTSTRVPRVLAVDTCLSSFNLFRCYASYFLIHHTIFIISRLCARLSLTLESRSWSPQHYKNFTRDSQTRNGKNVNKRTRVGGNGVGSVQLRRVAESLRVGSTARGFTGSHGAWRLASDGKAARALSEASWPAPGDGGGDSAPRVRQPVPPSSLPHTIPHHEDNTIPRNMLDKVYSTW